MCFFGRHAELTDFRREFEAERASLMVIYGRRRVGKSELIREATHALPHVTYQATRVTSALNLDAFKIEIARALGTDDVLASLGDWFGVLTYLARMAESRPGLIVVLDEFPYLVEGNPALPSVLQKIWDSRVPQAGRLKLILCGSMIAHMEDLLAEKNPLYGRKTLSLDLGPLPLRDAARFFPGYSPEDKLMAYGIFGGIPHYLRLCDPGASLQDNVVRLLLTSTGSLVDEPTVLLQSELRDIHRYASVLAAIADGCTKYGEIIGRIGDTDSKKIAPYIERLTRMRLIRAVRSMDATPNARDRRYFVADPLITFWHRFVRPNLSSVTQGFGSEVWRLQIAPRLQEFMGLAFEEICREHVRRHIQERLPAPAQEIGQIWASDHDIDVVGRLLDGSMLYGECKWSQAEIGEGVLDTLIDRAEKAAYGQGEGRRFYALYGRTGFKPGVRKRAADDPTILLYSPKSMLQTPARKPGPRTAGAARGPSPRPVPPA
jgi:AAA+ ATPase superfamily predicted ATPase